MHDEGNQWIWIKLRVPAPVGEAADVSAVCRALPLSTDRQGRIKTVKIGARTIVRSAELERFLDEQQAA